MRSGFELFLNDGLWYDGNIEHSIEQMLSARVEGVIISGPMQIQPERGKELLEALASANIPVVMISTYMRVPGFSIPAIEADFAQGFRALTEHLIEQGCRRMMIETSPQSPGGQLRYDGFQKAIAAHHGILHPAMPIEAYKNPWRNEGGIEGVLVDSSPALKTEMYDPCNIGSRYLETLMKRGLEVDAILSTNDYHAFGMLTTCYRNGMKIPEAFAITGADNSYLSQQGPVAITSLQQPIEEMCARAVDTLVQHIKGTATDRHQGVILPCRIIIRESSSIQSSVSAF